MVSYMLTWLYVVFITTYKGVHRLTFKFARFACVLIDLSVTLPLNTNRTLCG